MPSVTNHPRRPRRETPDPGASRSGRRADAERNIAAILDAGLACFSRNAEATVAEIAQSAGVGRVTLYGHFPSRKALVDAVFAHALGKFDAAMDTVVMDSSSASEALSRLIRSSWRTVDEHRRALIAAQRHLTPARIRQHHDQAMARVERLIARGQDEGDFRADLASPWMVAAFYSMLHGAAEEVDAGRLDPAEAPDVLEATLMAAFARQGG